MATLKKQRVGAAAGIVAPIIAFVCISTAILSEPAFSWTNNALSDLGIVPGLTGIVFNFGLVASGFFAFLFTSLALFPFLGDSKVGKGGAAIFAAATVALMAIGVFNAHYFPTHFLVSVAFFVSAPIAFFVVTAAFALGRQRGLEVFSVLVGVVAALPWILEFTVHYASDVAIPETVSGLAVCSWIIVLSVRALTKRGG